MYSRTSPYSSFILERSLLTKEHSSKKTYHISLSVDPALFSFKAGDSVAILPQNSPEEVEQILHLLHAAPDEVVLDLRTHESHSIYDYLLHKVNLQKLSSSFMKEMFEQNSLPLPPFLLPENKALCTEFVQTHNLLDFLTTYPIVSARDIPKCLPLLPRFYSIANSPLTFPNEIHLTVAYVQYLIQEKARKGVASHFLCDLAHIQKTPVQIYVQPSQHFTLPQDLQAPIILIGPGTGIAPYRAFLQERIALQAPGPNWLFFGERNRSSDFYYESFWNELEQKNRLKLSLAFSRDDPLNKTYVQHQMYKEKKELWAWLQQGSYLYVCGDAQEMAKDVEATLCKIAEEEGSFTEQAAKDYIKELKKEKRYLTDVY